MPSSHIQNKIHSLKIEKDILTKTISRFINMMQVYQKFKKTDSFKISASIRNCSCQNWKIRGGKHPDWVQLGWTSNANGSKTISTWSEIIRIIIKIAVANVQVPEVKKEKPKKEVKEEIKKPEIKIEEVKPKEDGFSPNQ